MKKIIILIDSTNEKARSYMKVLEEVENGVSLIYTNCLDFFNFSLMEKGYDVEVRKENGEYLILSELLTGNQYTNRKISKYHDTRKLLISNEFRFKTGV